MGRRASQAEEAADDQAERRQGQGAVSDPGARPVDGARARERTHCWCGSAKT